MNTVFKNENASLLEEVDFIKDVVTISRKAKRANWIMEKTSTPKKLLKKLTSSGMRLGESFKKRKMRRKEKVMTPTVPFPIRIIANSAYKTGGK